MVHAFECALTSRKLLICKFRQYSLETKSSKYAAKPWYWISLILLNASWHYGNVECFCSHRIELDIWADFIGIACTCLLFHVAFHRNDNNNKIEAGKCFICCFLFLSFRLSKIFDELIFMIRNKKKERRVLYGVLWMCNPYTCTVHSSCIEYRFNWYYSVYLFFPNGFLINICVLNSHHLCIECELSKTKPCFDMRHIFRGLQPINGYLGIRSMLQWKRTISIRTPNVSTTLRYVNIVDTLASI